MNRSNTAMRINDMLDMNLQKDECIVLDIYNKDVYNFNKKIGTTEWLNCKKKTNVLYTYKIFFFCFLINILMTPKRLVRKLQIQLKQYCYSYTQIEKNLKSTLKKLEKNGYVCSEKDSIKEFVR